MCEPFFHLTKTFAHVSFTRILTDGLQTLETHVDGSMRYDIARFNLVYTAGISRATTPYKATNLH